MRQTFHWCFIDPNHMDYHVLSPEQIPLGGSQSALSYLSRALTRNNQQVTLVNNTSQPGYYDGVHCQTNPAQYPNLPNHIPADLYIALNDFKVLAQIPPAPPEHRYLRLFWNQHNDLVPGMNELKHALKENQLDGVIFVSEWQRDCFIQKFSLSPEDCFLQPNAMSPCFTQHYQSPAFKALKNPSITLSYTSNPGRGLGVLLAIFPALKHCFPELQLRVYSSLVGYQGTPDQEAHFDYLYQECKSLKGVRHCVGYSQKQLAKELEGVHFFAYPNRYMETSCISAIEALAAGNKVVSTKLGALPETCQQHARLIPYQQDHRAYTFAYYQALETEILSLQNHPERYFAEIEAGNRWALQQYHWPDRARNWIAMANAIFKQSGEVNY